MVVVSGSWGKNVATYPTPMSNDVVINNNTNKMCAKAILICRPNSHPFQERALSLDQPVKVGRSVARARATPTNAIFDCKVLSRNHALLWYESGKFYLQDTKSSNGTYVNNDRLSSNETDHHEVSSGDIVQFGVDVVENNRKVTHGCIIAMLKLYLPDGKEAKASLSITEGNKHGYVPLDELYKLNQVIQEASQREQHLETKLSALQQVVSEARKSADDSWQAYVGEERLLSRVAALERQLMQANKGWSDEKIREELDKLQEDRASYQIAAKEALRKLHLEKLEASSAASDEQRARVTAEQEAILVKEQLLQAQQEIEILALKLSEEQKKMDDEKAHSQQKERELQAKLDSETEKLNEVQSKVDQLKALSINPIKDLLPLDELEKCNIIYNDDLIKKEELLEENEEETDLNKSNGVEPNQNHINLTVAPVTENADNISDHDSSYETVSVHTEVASICSSEDLARESTIVENNDDTHDDYDEQKENNESEKEDYSPEMVVDSRTLKYQFQTVQNDLKKQIEHLQSTTQANQIKIVGLEQALKNEKELTETKSEEIKILKQTLQNFDQKLKENSSGRQQLQDEVSILSQNLKEAKNKLKESSENSKKMNGVNIEQFSALEEELVILKESFARISQEKLELNKTLENVRGQYNSLCNRSYNNMFFYIGPLVLMVLYLLISNIFS